MYQIAIDLILFIISKKFLKKLPKEGLIQENSKFHDTIVINIADYY